jgi:hypothetical protein
MVPIACRISFKVHILDAHSDSFQDNMEAYSEEQSECFNQDILELEQNAAKDSIMRT